MAVVQQTVLTSNLQWSRKIPGSSIFNLNQSLNGVLFSSDKKIYRRRLVLGNGGGVKSSLDYDRIDRGNNGYYEYEKGLMGMVQQYPRPTEIPWKKELCNSVQLIGNIATPVQSKQLNSGKVVAWCRLAVKKSSTNTSWINLNFWDELAYIAVQHVEKGQQIYVSGRLVSDTVETEDGTQQTYYKVVVQQLNFIARNFSSVTPYDWDVNSSTMTPVGAGTKQKNYATNSTGSVEELWQAYFANPGDWWDNRKDKRNPNYPDFKHKDTGEALWVDGRCNPSWVKSQLSVLDSRMESFREQDSSNMRSDLLGDNLTPY